MFMDHKIGNGTLYLQRCSCGDGAAAGMDLDSYIKSIGHITDFLHFCNSATGSYIRLDDLDRILLEIFNVLPPGIDSFAVGNGQSRFFMDKFTKSEDYRRDELIRIIEHSVENLTLQELEALYYDMTTKNFIND